LSEVRWMYRVQRLEIDGWHDVPETDFYELFRAIQKAKVIWEKTNQDTQVVNERGACVWPRSNYPEPQRTP